MDRERIKKFRCMSSDTYIQSMLDECLDEIEQLQAENKELRENLIEYGRHCPGCSHEFAAKYGCRCGWDKVEKILKGE